MPRKPWRRSWGSADETTLIPSAAQAISPTGVAVHAILMSAPWNEYCSRGLLTVNDYHDYGSNDLPPGPLRSVLGTWAIWRSGDFFFQRVSLLS